MSNNQHSDQSQELEQPISKSELKRQMLALQELGNKLVALSDSQLKQIDMPTNLYDSVHRARKITKHEGLRRELQYIGKIMRNINVEPIRDYIERLESGKIQDSQQFHLKEQWRQRLVDEPKALTEFINTYPNADVQQLRQSIRSHHKAKNEAQKTKAFRLIFKLVQAQIDD